MLVLSACAPRQIVKPPEFVQIRNVEILELTNQDMTVRARILFYNINPIGGTMENITFSSFINGHLLGASRIQGTVRIKADERFELVLDTRLRLGSITTGILSALNNPEAEIEIKGQATLVTAIKNFTFSFNPKSRVEIKNRLKDLFRQKLLSHIDRDRFENTTG